MKYALTLLFILMLGFFASQAINLDPVNGYDASIKDTILLQNIHHKVDMIKSKNPERLEQIENKLPQIFSLFQQESQESYILHDIYEYIVSVNQSAVILPKNDKQYTSPPKNSRSDEMIIAIGEEIG